MVLKKTKKHGGLCDVLLCLCVQDLRNQLYESYYLNFISAISRSKLEDIASAALGANAVSQVTKVAVVTLNFL